ncbi:hypothetical protein Sjap_014064 [Stephania japonica]|uniref:Uncharacterized protein n=1 Tax=Stephania japonica TaxID=461633 RepID=A0AAP0NYA4_9MAGN
MLIEEDRKKAATIMMMMLLLDYVRRRMATNGERIKRKKSSDVDPNQGLTAAANRLADAFAHTDYARLQKELRSIPELSREDIMRAMLLLGSEVKDANIFFQLDEDLKKDWVILYLQRKF